MSRPLCSLRSSIQHAKLKNGSPLFLPRMVSDVRRYSYAALKTLPKSGTTAESQRTGSRIQNSITEDVDDFDSRGMAALGSKDQTTLTDQSPESDLQEHLNGLFPPLRFPPDLARRILTHGSHPSAIHGHNAGLRFIGRRVIESYLLLFLNSSSAFKATHDPDSILDRTVNTYVLGEHVGSSWGLGRALRWVPAVPASQVASTPNSRELLRSVGLYKVQGDTVAAVLGGIFFQFGATTAQRVFHTRVLPKLCLERKSEGLPDAFHADALAMCSRMGGPDAQLIQPTDTTPQKAEVLTS